jgi:hypothetical protein
MRPLYPGLKWPGNEIDHVVLRFRMSAVIPPLPLHAFMCGQGQLYLFNQDVAEGYEFIIL